MKQRESILKAYRAFSVNCNKVTHVGRARGAIDLAHAGVPEGSIERLGFWGLDSMNGSYLSQTLPVDCLRVLAGFGKDEPYFLKRNTIQPPDELKEQIFPWIDDLEVECRGSIDDHGSEFSGNSFA